MCIKFLNTVIFLIEQSRTFFYHILILGQDQVLVSTEITLGFCPNSVCLTGELITVAFMQ